jgi:hypothetical protein
MIQPKWFGVDEPIHFLEIGDEAPFNVSSWFLFGNDEPRHKILYKRW